MLDALALGHERIAERILTGDVVEQEMWRAYLRPVVAAAVKARQG